MFESKHMFLLSFGSGHLCVFWCIELKPNAQIQEQCVILRSVNGTRLLWFLFGAIFWYLVGNFPVRHAVKLQRFVSQMKSFTFSVFFLSVSDQECSCPL